MDKIKKSSRSPKGESSGRFPRAKGKNKAEKAPKSPKKVASGSMGLHGYGDSK